LHNSTDVEHHRQPRVKRKRDNFRAVCGSAETRELILTTVDRVIIDHDAIEVTLSIKEEGGSAASINDERTSESRNTLRLLLPTPRPRERKEIFIPGNSATPPRRIDQALILALARARSWMRALRKAEFIGTAEIAQRFGRGSPTSHPDRQAAVKRHTSRLDRPTRCVRLPLRIWDAPLPKTRHQKWPPETGGENGALVTGFETRRLSHILRTPPNRRHFEHSPAIT
jgi:hypothetical protein